MSDLFAYKTVVDVVATSKNMTTKERFKDQLGITVETWDDMIDDFIRQASALMVAYARREFASEKVTDSFRPTGDEAIRSLWLSRVEITTLHAVVENGVTLSASEYEVIARTGELLRRDASGNPTYWDSTPDILITAQHTSGFVMLTTLPNDLEAACITQVKAMFMNRKNNPALRSINLPDVIAKTFALPGGDNFGEKSGLLLGVEAALEPYLPRA